MYKVLECYQENPTTIFHNGATFNCIKTYEEAQKIMNERANYYQDLLERNKICDFQIELCEIIEEKHFSIKIH